MNNKSKNISAAVIVFVMVVILIIVYSSMRGSGAASVVALASLAGILAILYKKYSANSGASAARNTPSREITSPHPPGALLAANEADIPLNGTQDVLADMDKPLSEDDMSILSAVHIPAENIGGKCGSGEMVGVSGSDEDTQYKWGSNQSYTTCYESPSYDYNGCDFDEYIDADERVMRFAQLRERSKKSIDGYVTKNANYYKKHFGNELEDTEHRVWWGNDEY